MPIKSKSLTSLLVAAALAVGQTATLVGSAQADSGRRGEHWQRPHHTDQRPAPRYSERDRGHRGHRDRDGAVFAGIAALAGAAIIGSIIADRERARRHHDDD